MRDQEEFEGQTPPYHFESEQAVLGALLLNNEAFYQVADKLSEGDFFTRDHRMIYAGIVFINARNQPVDIVSLADYLDSRQQLADCGGVAYLGSLVHNTPSAANIGHYASVVVDRSILRKLAQESDEIRARAFKTNGTSGKELLDIAQSKFMAISQRVEKGASSMQSMQQILPELADHIDAHFMRREAGDSNPVIGLETSLRDLDELTTGLQGGDLIIIAGRPSMGKTALAINIAEHAAVNLSKAVHIFTFEMSSKQLTNRMLASLSGINSQRQWTGRLYDGEWDGLTTGIGKLNEAPIYMDEDSTLTVNDIKARARRLHREIGGLSLIVVDYLQLIATRGSGNRAEDLSEISRELKRLAKELDVPVIAISQLSRSVESRPNKRPIMSDIRESGAIEQDADLIMFVYRDEYYNKDSAEKGMAEIIVAKQRNGPVRTVRATFDANLTKFKDYEGGYQGDDHE
ncbi:MAG TPA: replicative DNA helicase [Methylophilus sp.]|uniref:replicative DNA helicase n=1 Tax=Methylophilus sp. TaxID=29541 RepID=UPI002C413204|nr:replicative DNA helicase [Methylophilus sp.]HSH86873.1 replicative DNA helicase [Methylophilus sp.]